MSRVSRLRPFTVAAALCLLLTLSFAPAAFGSLILSRPDQTSGTGLGSVNTVLTIDETPVDDRIHSGCVAWDGSMDVEGPAACPAGIAGGNEVDAQTQTRTFTEVGVSSAVNLRVVFNYNEPQSGPDVNDITIEDMVLTIYAADGTECFTSGPFTPQTFLDTFSGIGNSGFVFRLDAQQAAQAQPCIVAGARIGLASTLTGADQGSETFFIADATALGEPLADLSVTKTDDSDPVVVNTTLTYTVTVTNDGPNSASNVTVVDTLPSSVSFGSATVTTGDGTCTVDGRIVTCELGTLDPGDTEVITIVVTPTTDGVTLTNNVLVVSDQPDPDSADNTATETTTVGTGGAAEVDLSVVKTDSPDPVVVGSDVTYTLTVRNAGPDDATGVILTDQLPTSVTFASADAPCSASGGTVTCDLGTLAAGTETTVEIVVTTTVTTTLDNFAQVSADETETNPADNSDREETTVVAEAPADQVDLVLTKTDSTDPVDAGTDFTYTLGVTNVGGTEATNVVLVDNLPATVVFVSASPECAHDGAATGGTVTCDLGSLAASGNNSVMITVTAPNADTSLTNSASVSADQPDQTPADNTATETTLVQTTDMVTPNEADLSIVKTDSPDPVAVGQTLTYTLTVNNAGPDTATGVTVTDNLSPLVVFVSASAGCSHDGAATGGTVSCDVADLTVGASAQITITVTAQTSGAADDFAAVSAEQTDVDTGDNTTTERTTIGVPPGTTPAADLVLMKSASPNPVAVGGLLTYSLTVTNDGPDPATGVLLSDFLPATVECVNASSPDTPVGGTCECPADALGGIVLCDLGTLALNDSAIVTIQVRPTAVGTLVNEALVSADQSEPAFADNVAEATTTVQEAPAILAIPTLGQWSMILLGLLLGVGGLWILRRQ